MYSFNKYAARTVQSVSHDVAISKADVLMALEKDNMVLTDEILNYLMRFCDVANLTKVAQAMIDLQRHQITLSNEFLCEFRLIPVEHLPHLVSALIQLKSLDLPFVNDHFCVEFIKKSSKFPFTVSSAILSFCHGMIPLNEALIDFILLYPEHSNDLLIRVTLLEKIGVSLACLSIAFNNSKAPGVLECAHEQDAAFMPLIKVYDTVNANFVIHLQMRSILVSVKNMIGSCLPDSLLRIIQGYLEMFTNTLEDLPFNELSSVENYCLPDGNVVQSKKMIIETLEIQLQPSSAITIEEYKSRTDNLTAMFPEQKIPLRAVQRYLHFYNESGNVRYVVGADVPACEQSETNQPGRNPP